MSNHARMTPLGGTSDWVALQDAIDIASDCAKICASCAKTIATGVRGAGEFCAYSAEACEYYAVAAEQNGAPFEPAAVACRVCADECRDMGVLAENTQQADLVAKGSK